MLSATMCLLLILTACKTDTTAPTTSTVTGIVSTTTATTSTTVTTPVTTTTTAPVTGTTGAVMVKDVKGRLVEKPQYGGAIIYRSAASNFGSWDPNTSTTGLTALTHGSIYDQLTGADWSVDRSVNNYQSMFVDFFQFGKGAMMESYEVSDPLTYIVHLRHGMLWQNKAPVNGREVIADDVKYSVDRTLGLGAFAKDGPGAQSMTAWACLKEATVIDKYTIKFTLKYATPLFPQYWGCEYMPWVVPHEVVEKYGKGFKWDQAVGSGPWQVSDYVLDSSLTFVKNPTYYGVDDNFPENHIPYADMMRALVIPDWSTALAALRTGKISSLGGVGADDYKILTTSNPSLLWAINKGAAQALEINNSLKPWSDIRVRKAMQMSINLQEMNDVFSAGKGDNFPAMVCADFTDVSTKFEDYPADVQEGFTYNPTKAKALLAEAGYPNGFNQIMPLSGPDTGIDMVCKYFEAIGIKTEQKIMDIPSLYGYIFSGNQQMVWYWSYGNWMPLEILNNVYGGQKTTYWNFGNVDDPKFNKMVDDIRAESDPAKRTAMTKAAFVYGTSQFFTINRPSTVSFSFWQPWYKGYQGEVRLGAIQTAAIPARIWLDQGLKYKLTGQR